jgi:hypothetical protein
MANAYLKVYRRPRLGSIPVIHHLRLPLPAQQQAAGRQRVRCRTRREFLIHLGEVRPAGVMRRPGDEARGTLAVAGRVRAPGCGRFRAGRGRDARQTAAGRRRVLRRECRRSANGGSRSRELGAELPSCAMTLRSQATRPAGNTPARRCRTGLQVVRGHSSAGNNTGRQAAHPDQLTVHRANPFTVTAWRARTLRGHITTSLIGSPVLPAAGP